MTALNQTTTPVIKGTAVTYTFTAISSGYEANVSVSVPQGLGIAWTVSVGGTFVGAMQGSSPFGEFYVGSSQTVVITGKVPAGLTTGNAVMLGELGQLGTLGPSAPISGGGTNGPGIYQVANNITTPETLTEAIETSSQARGIIVAANALPTAPPAAFGVYLPLNQAAITIQSGGTSPDSAEWFLSLQGTASLQIAFASATTWTVNEVDYDFDFYEVARSLGTWSVTVPWSDGGDWGYILPWPGRLLQAAFTIETGVTGGNRYPGLYVQDPGDTIYPRYFMTPGAVAAATAVNITAGVGMGPPVQMGAYAQAGFPSIMLPAGSSVGTLTDGILTGDIYASISLTFAAI